jgi:hypothetical protein
MQFAKQLKQAVPPALTNAYKAAEVVQLEGSMQITGCEHMNAAEIYIQVQRLDGVERLIKTSHEAMTSD